MDWNTEEELVQQFIDSAHHLVKGPIQILREVRTGYGIPDIVIVEYNPNVLKKRKQLTNKVLSDISLYVMAYLADRRWVSKETVGRAFNLTITKVMGVLRELLERNLIVMEENLVKARPRSEILAVKRLLVFEAKLNQWKVAIDQAERNLWFTNDSYILLPIKKEKLQVSILQECEKRSVGLTFLGIEEGPQIKLRPARKGIVNSPFLWQVNEQVKEEKNEYG
ncbi:hypothetical protein [Bacillus cereus]|uniref:hypothetical protein n=1 Tax=Bacillus cereus TaxID=1396 RepID=UPI000BF6121E|nr:hypothetical protein [Bacillus cereus]PFC15991.1 hypothetical protein CN287_23275 [Bacillus cereus]HDR3493165.1 hypothetical protein [Bacillus wiedmannii]